MVPITANPLMVQPVAYTVPSLSGLSTIVSCHWWFIRASCRYASRLYDSQTQERFNEIRRLFG